MFIYVDNSIFQIKTCLNLQKYTGNKGGHLKISEIKKFLDFNLSSKTPIYKLLSLINVASLNAHQFLTFIRVNVYSR